MRVVVVHNHKAGARQHDSTSLLALLEQFGHEGEYFSSRDPAWKDALDPSVEVVAAAGGDGTVESVALAVAGSQTLVTVLPMGTANNVSGALGFTDVTVEQLVAGWNQGMTRAFDVGVARGPWGTTRFLESVGAGLLVEGMAAVKRGHKDTVKQIHDIDTRLTKATEVMRQVARDIRSSRFELSLDGMALSGDYLLIEALNLGAAGPALRFAPQADPSDGLLDVVLADERHRSALAEHLWMYRLAPQRAPSLPSWRARQITLRSERFDLHVDDEPVSAATECGGECVVELTVEPRAVRFLIPRTARMP